jgi:hypothetical protein
MKPAEVKKIYDEARAMATNTPAAEAAKLKLWQKHLGHFERQDLEAAVLRWYRSEVFLPMPCELEPLAIKAQRARTLLASVDFCGECALGWAMELRDGKFVRVPCGCRAAVMAAREAAVE